jgi:CrcB protein
MALYVALFGAIGSVARWAAVQWAQDITQSRYPWGTWLVNIVGSAAIGAVMTLYAGWGALDSRSRIAITAGFLGGFTTYSSFAFETVSLAKERGFVASLGYAIGTLVTCVGGCALGVLVTKR